MLVGRGRVNRWAEATENMKFKRMMVKFCILTNGSIWTGWRRSVLAKGIAVAKTLVQLQTELLEMLCTIKGSTVPIQFVGNILYIKNIMFPLGTGEGSLQTGLCLVEVALEHHYSKYSLNCSAMR
jgi:hypothetical protein